MIELFLDWFLSRPKYERVLFVIDFVLLLVFLFSLDFLLSSCVSGSSEVIV